jgi:hypothetical protein
MMIYTFHVTVGPAAVGDTQARAPPKPAWNWACNVGGGSWLGSTGSGSTAAQATRGSGNMMVRCTFTCSSRGEELGMLRPLAGKDHVGSQRRALEVCSGRWSHFGFD